MKKVFLLALGLYASTVACGHPRPVTNPTSVRHPPMPVESEKWLSGAPTLTNQQIADGPNNIAPLDIDDPQKTLCRGCHKRK